ncbi:T9SS type A sorting domain-containing protein [Chryseobacterium sp. YR221]|uniref:T9SS type A sorting domain-containing protein n=1 Tax=Chryseobacterium sp. YR221 TaxID=1500293 RepID=UPI0009D88C5B|nr:T9SS type A sorting domain-containing protein [Chryseobacterium sp. YR221]SMD03032.1 Por secretion system C-terminal sorting domain-containing protein [Chryseobacterium sp. YR221]
MKTKYLLIIILCILFTIQIKAQPTITSADIITGTFPNTAVSLAPGAYSPGSGGANITWDFSNIQGTAIGVTFVWGVCPGIAECSAFPTANRYIALIDPSTGTQFPDKNMFRLTDTQFEHLGARNETMNFTYAYTDTPIELIFPLTYGQSFTDTSSVTDNTITTTTNDVFTADGYGTIITPAGTFTNVLRVKKVSTVTSSGAGTTSVTEMINYIWYKNNRETIAVFSIVNLISPVSAPQSSNFQYATNANLATENIQIEKKPIMYPNPVKDGKLWINIPSNTKIKSIRIYDMTGKQIFAELQHQIIQIGGKHMINMQNYPEGNYIVNMETDKNTISHTIQIRKSN